MYVGSLNLADTEMQVIVLKEVVNDPQGSLEALLEDLSHHIDTLAGKGHHFVIDTSDTAFGKLSQSQEEVCGGEHVMSTYVMCQGINGTLHLQF